ncbi:hypothetical protein ABZP36_020480 [Zizania latifolia]
MLVSTKFFHTKVFDLTSLSLLFLSALYVFSLSSAASAQPNKLQKKVTLLPTASSSSSPQCLPLIITSWAQGHKPHYLPSAQSGGDHCCITNNGDGDADDNNALLAGVPGVRRWSVRRGSHRLLTPWLGVHWRVLGGARRCAGGRGLVMRRGTGVRGTGRGARRAVRLHVDGRPAMLAVEVVASPAGGGEAAGGRTAAAGAVTRHSELWLLAG